MMTSDIKHAFSTLGQGENLYWSRGYDIYYHLIFKCGYVTATIISIIFGTHLVDRIGRRKLLMTGLTGCSTSLAVDTVIVAVYADAVTNFNSYD